MTTKQLAILTLALSFFATGAMATPMSASLDVHANNHVWNGGSGFGGNLGLDTGIVFALGDAFSVNVDDVNDTWFYCGTGSPATCEVNADGVLSNGTSLGPYSNSGYSFTFGTLVGRVGTGDFFSIGTAGFDGTSNAAGNLFLFHWDHNTNNSGTIAATVSYGVPAPATLALVVLGIAAAGGARRRIARS